MKFHLVPMRTTTHRLRVTLATIAVLGLLSSNSAMAEELAVGRFSAEGLAGWQVKSFHGLTDYRLIRENGQMVVQANSRDAASGLVKKIDFSPQKYRYLRWSWKIDKPITAGDETIKAGDDYAARVYVVFSGRFFWQTKAINYIWANKLTKGDFIANAYTAGAMMVAVQSGPANNGQWLSEKRDILADYKMLFGTEPGAASAIAIMTDTDDTGEQAVAWYGDISLTTD